MATVKQELREFYVNQGLRPQEIRKALRYDLRSIRKQRVAIHNDTGLVGALHWETSVEGAGYWLSRGLGYPSHSYRGSNHPTRVIR